MAFKGKNLKSPSLQMASQKVVPAYRYGQRMNGCAAALSVVAYADALAFDYRFAAEVVDVTYI